MFGIGGWELLVIVAVALLVLGPKRLPAAARAIGKGLQSLRRATIDLRRSIELDPEMEDLPQTLDELNRPLVTPSTFLGSSPRRRTKPDQDFGDVPPRPKPKKKSDSEIEEASAEGAETGDESAAEEPAGPEAERPASASVAVKTTREEPGSGGADEPSTDGDGRGEQGS